jgi:hypothetical protein
MTLVPVPTTRTLIRVASLLASCVAALVVSLAVGFYVGAYVLHETVFQSDPSDLDRQAAILEIQLRESDTPTSVELLSKYLVLLNADHPASKPRQASYLATERALTLARLSVATQGLGQQGASAKYLNQALALCGDMKWSHCDDAHLIAAAGDLGNGTIAFAKLSN